MTHYVPQPGQPHQVRPLPLARLLPLLLLSLSLMATSTTTAAVTEQQTRHPPVLALDAAGGGGDTPSGSSTSGIIIGVIVGVAGTLFVVAAVALFCILRRRRQRLHRRGHAYADADSIALQDDRHSNRVLQRQPQQFREGSEGTAGLYSHHTVESNEPVTPPQPPTAPQMRDRRENYADRATGHNAHPPHNDAGEDGYVEGDEVRPASPNAERVEGVAIENRVRPRRNLPRGRVTVHQGDQDVCLDFTGVQRVPQAGPPPLTHEEKQRLIDAQNRVASPEFYGTAEYEYRRASNTNTPNVLLSSSLLRELQQQYVAASAAGQVFPSYASDAGRSIGSMSFRPGSPAGSMRRGRQSTSPTSMSLGMGQNMRHRNTSSRQHTHSRDGAGGGGGGGGGAQQHASLPRHYRDDLESTSDDFEDLSLHNDSFPTRRERLRDASGRLLPTAGAFPPFAGSLGVDQQSRGSNSPAVFERYMSANGSVNASGLNGSVLSAIGVPSPLDGPNPPPVLLGGGRHTPQGLHAIQATNITSPVLWSAAGRSPPYPAMSKTGPAGSSTGAGQQQPPPRASAAAGGGGGAGSTSKSSITSPKSSSASPGVASASQQLSPPTPSNPIIRFIGDPTGASEGEEQREQWNGGGKVGGAA